MEKKTNNIFLKKGLSKLLWSIPFFFLGPIFLFQSFKNIDHDFFIYVLILGIILMLTAIINCFFGIKYLLNGFLGEKNKKSLY
tara:strand:- start:537 stop:785 length:249 start_codon:yes stop_codon:yes gene_type:complete